MVRSVRDSSCDKRSLFIWGCFRGEYLCFRGTKFIAVKLQVEFSIEEVYSGVFEVTFNGVTGHQIIIRNKFYAVKLKYR